MNWSCLGLVGLTVYVDASAEVIVFSSSGRPRSDSFFGEECSVRQLWIVSEPAGPVRYTVLEVSSLATSAADRQPVQLPLPSYCESIGSSRGLFGSTASGPCSMPESFR